MQPPPHSVDDASAAAAAHSYPTRQSPSPPPLPPSTRGAPDELKPAIRKMQNRESARRSRRRRGELLEALPQRLGHVETRLHTLENSVRRIERFLASRFEVESAAPHERAGAPAGGAEALAAGEAAGDDEVERLIDRCVRQL